MSKKKTTVKETEEIKETKVVREHVNKVDCWCHPDVVLEKIEFQDFRRNPYKRVEFDQVVKHSDGSVTILESK